ncbi:MAG TPA: hypothetical protein VH392_07290 [Sphingomicrobium sp.]|jgi:hypothetical protein
MFARFVLIAAAALTSVNAFAAEPVKPAQQQTAQPQHAQAPVVLASASDVEATPPADQQAQTPPKKRHARVTTCRCGDPQQPDPQK